jgi:single-strand DNA-binding protein
MGRLKIIKERIDDLSINQYLCGRLTAEPQTRYAQTNNTMVVNFTLAVNRRFAKEGEQSADFINIIAFSKTAEFVSKYFTKGQQVAVIGRIQTRNWEDDKKVKHYATEVIAEEVYFADSKKEANNTNVTSKEYDCPFEVSSDLPF